jgi:spore coat polysaccharide biosynthesis protein SpsF
VTRRLIAAVACRMEGSRLYGKPLQNLDTQSPVSVLQHIVSLLRTVGCIEEIVLGISEGDANNAFVEFAAARGLRHIRGDQRDVLGRLVACGRTAGATDVFRVTSESPFCYFDPIEEAWQRHIEHGNDLTVIDEVPDGCHFEIYRLAALEASHDRGTTRHRSEYCNLYIREHRDEFRVEVVPVPDLVRRGDLRFTVDYPEDLIVCRETYRHLKSQAPRIPLADIVRWLDTRPDLKALVAPYASSRKIW